MGKTAFVFPGQASQYPGMGKDLYDNFSASKRAFEEADGVLGFTISKLCFEGPEEKLQLTDITQPAILTVSIATFAALQQEGEACFDFCAGHSLGEYSALVAAGSLTLSEAVIAVHKRGRYMQEAVPLGKGAMVAVIGLDTDIIVGICEKIEKDTGLVITSANFNSPGQVVVAGDKEAIEKAAEEFTKSGARKVVILPVSAPFHCALMMPAQEKLAEDLKNIEFRNLNKPLITNVDAEIITDGEAARDSLIRQVSSPVRWEESVERLVKKGVDSFVEVGPGKVLTGLIKRIDKSVRTFNIDNAENLYDYLSRREGSNE